MFSGFFVFFLFGKSSSLGGTELTQALARAAQQWRVNKGKSDGAEIKDLAAAAGQYRAAHRQLLSIVKLRVPWCRAGLHRWRSQVSGSWLGCVRVCLYGWCVCGGRRCEEGGLFSVEEAICPSVSSRRPVPTGRQRGGYLKMGRIEDKTRGGAELCGRRAGRDAQNLVSRYGSFISQYNMDHNIASFIS